MRNREIAVIVASVICIVILVFVIPIYGIIISAVDAIPRLEYGIAIDTRHNSGGLFRDEEFVVIVSGVDVDGSERNERWYVTSFAFQRVAEGDTLHRGSE